MQVQSWNFVIEVTRSCRGYKIKGYKILVCFPSGCVWNEALPGCWWQLFRSFHNKPQGTG